MVTVGMKHMKRPSSREDLHSRNPETDEFCLKFGLAPKAKGLGARNF